METFEIAGTGLKPSRIGLGTWAIGGWIGVAPVSRTRSTPSMRPSSAGSR